MKKKISIMLCIVLFALTGCTNSGRTIRFGAADVAHEGIDGGAL